MAPPRPKLHSKTGKLKTIPTITGNKRVVVTNAAATASTSAPPTVTNSNAVATVNSPPPPTIAVNATQQGHDSDTDADLQFEVELCWCIQQLETSLTTGKLNDKQSQETEKNLKTLKSPNNLIIRKRHLMRSLFGDYRAKMSEEDKKMTMRSKNIKFDTKILPSEKSFFIKKSVFLSKGDNFKFNFSLDQIELLNIAKSNDSAGDGKLLKEEDSPEPEPEEAKVETEQSNMNNSFKYVPSENAFKFNFNVVNNES